MNDAHLFCRHELRAVLQANLGRARDIVEAIPAGQFAGTADDAIVEHVLSLSEILPLELFEEKMEVAQAETQVDVSRDPGRMFLGRTNGPVYVPGLQVMVSVPFSGEANLFYSRPSTCLSVFPSAGVRAARDSSQGGELKLQFLVPSDTLGDGARLKQDIERVLSEIRRYVGFVNADVGGHNAGLKPHIESCVRSRRARLQAHDAALKKLDIPLRKKEGAPDLSAIALKKRVVRPLPSAAKAKPDYALRDEDYEYILKVIRHEGRSFESAPVTFAKHDEEELRDILLAHLNGHFEGQATGETFRKQGKTDISIEFENRAAFVAECKVWTGQKTAKEAVVQILNYLTWRDCKAALIFFNLAVSGFQETQRRLEQALAEHEQCVKSVPGIEPGEWRFRFKTPDDADRIVTLHVFFFNLFVPRR